MLIGILYNTMLDGKNSGRHLQVYEVLQLQIIIVNSGRTQIMCGNNVFGNGSCGWVILLIIILCCCGGNGGCGDNNCGCGC